VNPDARKDLKIKDRRVTEEAMKTFEDTDGDRKEDVKKVTEKGMKARSEARIARASAHTLLI
jgi:hypothetical protein